MGNEDFIAFVMSIASDRFTREQVEGFVRGQLTSRILTEWQTLYDNGQQDVIRTQQVTWEGNPPEWQNWGDLEASETMYRNQIALLQKDLEVYQDANNIDDITATQKGIEDLKKKLIEIEIWKQEHPDTSTIS